MEITHNNPIHEVEASFNRAHEILGRVSQIVDRMVGSALAGASNQKDDVARYSGILGDLSERSRKLNGHIDSVGSALDRLERALPQAAQIAPDVAQLLGDWQASTVEIRAR